MSQQKCIQGRQGLQLNEQSLQILVETIPTLMWRAKPDGHFDYVNKRLLEYFGSPLEEIIGWGWMEKVHPDDVAFKVQSWLSNLETMTSQDANCRFQGADGAYRWFNVRGEPLRDSDGRVQHWYGVLIDIDERKKTENLLRRSEAHLAEAQRLSHTGAVAYNGTAILFASEETYHIWGFDPAQGLPSREVVFQRIHPGDRDWLSAEVRRAVDEKRRFSVAYRISLADGTVKHLETIGQPVFSASGKLVEIFATQTDVTERKRAEDALRESEYKLRRIVETVPSMLWSTAPDGEPTRLNQRILDYSGLRLEDFLSLGWKEFLHPEDLPETERAFFHAIQTGEPYEAVHRLRRADGQYRWHHARAEPLRDREQRVIQWYGLSVDIDERKRSEERLRVQHAIAQILAEAATIEEATPRILSAMGESLGWDVGVLWRVDRDAEGLRCVEIWHNGSIEVTEFERVSREFTFVPGLGLPGRVWSSLEPEYVPDVVRDENFPRGPIAEREGLHAAFGFPILLGGEILGVIEFFSREIRQPDQELLNMLATIGSQIGQFIERKRAEDALRESEAKFRDYAETASDWLCEMGPDYKFTHLSEHAFGSGAADRIGTACWDHALDLETEPEKWRLLQETVFARTPFRDFVYRGMSGDGSPMYVRASGKPLFDANGEFRGYRGTCTDVTEVMHAQEALRESERSSRSAIDGIAGLVAIMAPDGELDALNRQGIEYFGRSLEEMKNWGTSDAVHPEDLPRIAEIFKRSLVTGTPFHYELRLRRFDGEYRWFDNRGVPTREKSGRMVRWYILGTDIEDRKQAEASLRTAQAELAHVSRVMTLGQLTASIAHEVNQPIGSARNNARAALNFLDRRPPDLGEVREALGCIVADADRAGGIVERIRDQIKKVPPRSDPFDLNRAIEEVIGLAQSTITENGISVQSRLAGGMAPVYGDPVQLQQVVLNLVLNAVEAMNSVEADERVLLISTDQSEANGTLVAVCDSGPGIDPKHLERVFEAFYSTKSGMGMGLSICRSIIAAHGGRLWAEANEPRGTIFQFTLPAVLVGL